MADDLETRLQQEIDRLNKTSAKEPSKTITITGRSASTGAASMRSFQIHSNASGNGGGSSSPYAPEPGGGSSKGSGQASGGGNAAAQANADYPDEPAEHPATGDAPYTSPFREREKRPFPFPFPFEGGADPERVLTIALWGITIVGLLAILFNFRAVTDAIFVFFAELLVGLSSFLLVIGMIVAAVIFVVSRPNRRR